MNQVDLGATYGPVPSRGRFELPPALTAHAPLAGLAGTNLSRRFCYWRGASKRRYLFSVFPLESGKLEDPCPRFQQAVVLAVVNTPGREREIVCAGDTGEHPDGFFDSGRMQRAIAAGTNEIHVHLLTEDPDGRRAIVPDLEA